MPVAAGVGIKYEWDDRQILRFVRGVVKQLPFASVKTINTIVELMQQQQWRHQSRVFTIRRSQYWKQAVKIPPQGRANIKQRRFSGYMTIDPKRSKGPKFEIWQRQQYGGTRRPIGGRSRSSKGKGRQSIALPQPEVKRTSAGIIRAPERPKRIMEQKKRGFEIAFASGTRGLFMRTGPRQKGFTNVVRSTRAGHPKLSLREDPNVRFMYFLKPTTQIEPVYDYYENAARVFRGNWERVWSVQLKKAFGSARG